MNTKNFKTSLPVIHRIALVTAFLLMGLVRTEAISQTSASLTLDPQKAITQYGHDVWHYDEGLPQSAVQTIAQTPDGYLWLGLEEGLVRFDGMQFTVFDKRNTPEIRHNNIFALLAASSDSSLWIGTNGGGLIRLKDGKFTVYTTTEGLSNDVVRAIYEDRKGNLWIGTNDGLSCLKDGNFTLYATKDGLSHKLVLSIYEDSKNNLWIGTGGGGLNRLSDGNFITFTTKAGLANDVVMAIHEDKQGNLWIGTNGGLHCLQDGKFTVYTTKDGLANDFVRSIYEDSAGSLWIGTYGGGLNRFRDGEFSTFSTNEGLSNDFIRAVCEDREGSLWIGTYGGGLNRLRDGKFTNYSTSEGLSNNMVWSIYEDKAGNLWFGTDRGLNRFKDGKITIYSTRDGVPPHVIAALFEDRAGNLWIGTEGGGLLRKRNETFTLYTTQNGLSNNFVRFVHEDRNGNLWIGTDRGLNRFKDGKFKIYTTKEGLSNDELTYIFEDKAGSIWIGTRTGGLNRFQDGKFTIYTTQDGLSSNLVRCIYENEQGALWIGTNGGGLNRFKDGKFIHYTTREGLFDDLVFRILEDGQGNFWMSCNKGIFRASKQELEDFAQGKIKSISSVAYGKADGMMTNECNGGLGQPAGWKTRDGKLWFPTIKGVVTIDPDHIRINTFPPPVIIEQVLVEDQPIAADGKAKLAPGSKHFEFYYTGLSLLAPQKVKFKYKLEGFDKEWVDAETRRIAYYTNIPPGDYDFRVKACNNDGLWNEAGASFAFYLKPYFYRTNLFYLACLLALVSAGMGAYRLRVRQIRAREQRLALLNQELERRVAGRTAELQESEGRFRQLAENIHEVLWMESLDTRQLLYVSPEYEKIWGRTCQSLYEQPNAFLSTVFPDDQESFKFHLHKQRRGEFSELEYRIVRSDGSIRWIWDRSFPIRNGNGKVYRSAGIAEDITERKRMEGQIRQYTEELEKLVEQRAARIQELERQRAESEKLAATGRMAARIAHEINNPLGGIKNSFLLIKDAIPSDHQYFKYVSRIEREIERIARIVRQMFDLYKPEQGLWHEFPIEEAIRDIVALLEPSRREKGATIEVDTNNSPPTVTMPEGPLRQVLFNLIQNAIEASPSGGLVKIDALTKGKTLTITVSDQGNGIPEELRTRIFEPFFTTKSDLVNGGVGLGLSVSKSIVETLKGSLTFESEIGKGTVFRISLPVA
jgi:PAS domain S-box-containing protein